MSYFVRGSPHDSGLSYLDYYLMPEIATREQGNAVVLAEVDSLEESTEGSDGQQTVVLGGLGMPFDPPQVPSGNAFEFGGRKFFSNENLYLVTSSIPFSLHPNIDTFIAELLSQDPNALAVLVPDAAEVSMWFSMSSEVSYRLGPRQWCRRLLSRIRSAVQAGDEDRIILLKPLAPEEKTELFSIASCVVSFGNSITVVEAVALNVPVVCQEGAGLCEGINKRVGGLAEGECIASGAKSLAEVATRVANQDGVRHGIVAAIKGAKEEGRTDDVMQEIGSTDGGKALTEFLDSVGRPFADLRREITAGG